jgi:glycogen debranching enzyme
LSILNGVILVPRRLYREGRIHRPLGSLHLTWRKFLWKAALYQELRIENYAMEAVDFAMTMRLAADFADIYEVRGMRRQERGTLFDPDVVYNQVKLRYRGLHRVLRETELDFTPNPHRFTTECAAFDVSLAPRESASFHVTVHCATGREHRVASQAPLPFERARAELRADLEAQAAGYSGIETDSGQFNALVRRTMADLHMLTTVLPTGPYPYAGVPWFNTPFGRDGIITALECLWLNPGMARGVLAYLAQTQATEIVPEQDAEPGKILHETRNGEMAVLREMPFARYYGTVDATPLFVVLAGEYYERTGDRAFIEEIWPNIGAALEWMKCFGDRDGDGLLEYQRRAGNGLVHQGWKDSDDAVFTPTDQLQTARSRCAKCRHMLMAHGGRRRNWRKR